MSWKEILTSDLPPIGSNVLLLCRSTTEVAIATHMLDLDAQPQETYWYVHGLQYAIYEKWTHWCAIPPIPL